MITLEAVSEAQRAHIASLAKAPNDFHFGAQSFLEYAELHDGEYACIEDLFGALTYDATDETIWHIEDGVWPTQCIAPLILKQIKS